MSPAGHEPVVALQGLAEASRRRSIVLASVLGVTAAVVGALALVRPPDGAPIAARLPEVGPRDAGLVAPVDVDGGPSTAGCHGYEPCRRACVSDPGDVRACVRAADHGRYEHSAAGVRVAITRDRYRALCRATGDLGACTRLALITGLVHDLAVAPDWLDPAQAPAGLLEQACATATPDGLLACAALVLLDLPGLERATPEARLASACAPDVAPVACAIDLARRACQDTDLLEACYLWATAEPAGVAFVNIKCEVRDDPVACLYVGMASRTKAATLLACSDVDQQAAVARGCLERPAGSTAQRLALRKRACLLGACDGVTDLATLTTGCTAGHLHACATLLALPAARLSSTQRASALARAAELAPDVDLARPPAPLPALVQQYEACRYGAAPACDAIIAALPATSPLRLQLAAYAARLRAPFTP